MKDARGFTLIEVLVAATVFGMVATALFGLMGSSLSNLRKVEELHQYELEAQDVMNRVLFLPSLPVPATAEGADNFGGRWTVNIEPWAPPTMEKPADPAVVRVHVVVRWPGRSTDRTVELDALKVTKLDSSDLQNRLETAYPR